MRVLNIKERPVLNKQKFSVYRSLLLLQILYLENISIIKGRASQPRSDTLLVKNSFIYSWVCFSVNSFFDTIPLRMLKTDIKGKIANFSTNKYQFIFSKDLQEML